MLAAPALTGSKFYRPAPAHRHHRQPAPPPAPLRFSAPTFIQPGVTLASDSRILPFPWRGTHSLNLPAQIDVADPCDASAEDCELIVCFILPSPSDSHPPSCRRDHCSPQCRKPVRLLGFCHPEFSSRNGKRLFFSYLGPPMLLSRINQPGS